MSAVWIEDDVRAVKTPLDGEFQNLAAVERNRSCTVDLRACASLKDRDVVLNVQRAARRHSQRRRMLRTFSALDGDGADGRTWDIEGDDVGAVGPADCYDVRGRGKSARVALTTSQPRPVRRAVPRACGAGNAPVTSAMPLSAGPRRETPDVRIDGS